jgi:sec-independent protein translocase protein TatC
LENSKLPLTEHLSELRKRILVSVAVLGIAFLFIFNYSEELFNILTFPLKSEMKFDLTKPFFHIKEKTPVSLVFLAPAEAFWMHMKVSFVASFIVALPVIFFQIWKFVSPGLLANEKKYVIPFVFSSTALFLVGALFCFTIILPFAMTFLLGYKTGSLTPMISVGSYVDFCMKFILAFGAIFELPLVIVFLAKFGIVSPGGLAKNRKYAILFSFIAAAVLTPTPDAFNQVLMAVPIIILYEIGILLSVVIYRKKKNA